MTVNDGFWDLTAEERGQWYDKAREETGIPFWDLDTAERAQYYQRASEDLGSVDE